MNITNTYIVIFNVNFMFIFTEQKYSIAIIKYFKFVDKQLFVGINVEIMVPVFRFDQLLKEEI
jgi:hypothetical protein